MTRDISTPDVTVAEARPGLRYVVERLMDTYAPSSFDGMRVLIKPNMMGPFPGNSGVITHPALLRAVVRACLDRRAKVIAGDNPGDIVHNTRYVSRVAGFDRAAEGCFTSLSERVSQVPALSAYADTFLISRAILEADYVINLPILKTHVLTLITGAVKNCFGYIAGQQKALLHLKAPSRRRFSELLVDLYRVRPPDLVIMDATTVMEGNGPTHGPVRPFGRILAGTNGPSVDATAARLIGIDPHRVQHLKIACECGLGKLDDLRVAGPLAPLPDVLLPSTFGPATEKTRQDIVRSSDSLIQRINHKPLAEPEKCTTCGDCQTSCPPQAIRLVPYPVIGDNCTACYCCVELCPQGAMDVPELSTTPT